MNPNHPTSIWRMDAIRRALRTADYGLFELAEFVHITSQWLRPYMKYMLGQREIYIKKWKKRHKFKGAWTPIYAVGANDNLQKPKILTSKQRGSLYRKKMKKDDDRYDAYLQRKRTRRMKVKPDPLVNALFGK